MPQQTVPGVLLLLLVTTGHSAWPHALRVPLVQEGGRQRPIPTGAWPLAPTSSCCQGGWGAPQSPGTRGEGWARSGLAAQGED